MRSRTASHAAANWSVINYENVATCAREQIRCRHSCDSCTDYADLDIQVVAQGRGAKFSRCAFPKRDIIASSFARDFHTNESRARVREGVHVAFSGGAQLQRKSRLKCYV